MLKECMLTHSTGVWTLQHPKETQEEMSKEMFKGWALPTPHSFDSYTQPLLLHKQNSFEHAKCIHSTWVFVLYTSFNLVLAA